jgi:hypothetical protein
VRDFFDIFGTAIINTVFVLNFSGPPSKIEHTKVESTVVVKKKLAYALLHRPVRREEIADVASSSALRASVPSWHMRPALAQAEKSAD